MSQMSGENIMTPATVVPPVPEHLSSSTTSGSGSLGSRGRRSPHQPTKAPVMNEMAVQDKNGDHMMILRNPHYSKSSGFTLLERKNLGVEGLLPARVETLLEQVHRCKLHLQEFSEPLAKYTYLSSLRERNQTIFYALLKCSISELMPYVYTPTVGLACQKFGALFRHPEGLYITLFDNVDRILSNWRPSAGEASRFGKETEPGIIVITDGSRILGLGDLGVNGMGIPIGKLSLYVAVGGFHPLSILPICIDVGTNNDTLLEDPMYMGIKAPRPEADVYMAFMHKVVATLGRRWPRSVIQFEDFENRYCFELLDQTREKFRTFNDDIQGTGVVTAAAVISAMKIMKKEADVALSDHRIVVFGFGSAAAGVANSIVDCLHDRMGVDKETLQAMFYMIDSRGMCTDKRARMPAYKRTFARKDGTPDGLMLEEAVRYVKPTILIGLAGVKGGSFSEVICKLMAEYNKRPAIFALSNPNSQAECTFRDAHEWTDGRVIYCAGSPMDPVDGGQDCSQCNNLYAFPGIGFGCWLAQCKITDVLMTTAANAISDITDSKSLAKGLLFPPIDKVCEVSDYIAAEIMDCAARNNLTDINVPESIQKRLEIVRQARYTPEYQGWVTCATNLMKQEQCASYSSED